MDPNTKPIQSNAHQKQAKNRENVPITTKLLEKVPQPQKKEEPKEPEGLHKKFQLGFTSSRSNEENELVLKDSKEIKSEMDDEDRVHFEAEDVDFEKLPIKA